jgi:hypothetical protein
MSFLPLHFGRGWRRITTVVATIGKVIVAIAAVILIVAIAS